MASFVRPPQSPFDPSIRPSVRPPHTFHYKFMRLTLVRRTSEMVGGPDASGSSVETSARNVVHWVLYLVNRSFVRLCPERRTACLLGKNVSFERHRRCAGCPRSSGRVPVLDPSCAHRGVSPCSTRGVAGATRRVRRRRLHHRPIGGLRRMPSDSKAI